MNGPREWRRITGERRVRQSPGKQPQNPLRGLQIDALRDHFPGWERRRGECDLRSFLRCNQVLAEAAHVEDMVLNVPERPTRSSVIGCRTAGGRTRLAPQGLLRLAGPRWLRVGSGDRRDQRNEKVSRKGVADGHPTAVRYELPGRNWHSHQEHPSTVGTANRRPLESPEAG
jgi:hypothetical protein